MSGRTEHGAQGAYYVNPYASADLAAAKAAGLATMAYAFAIPNGDGASASAVAQDDYLLTRAAEPDGQLPSVMLDIEYDPYNATDHGNQCYGLSQSARRTWISAFGSEVMTKTGRLPVIYSTQDWWAACAGSTAFSQYPLWVADYTTAPAPAVPAGWATWNLWQYTSTGTVAGIPDSAGQAPSLAATGLPPGVSVSTAGQVTGWPTTPGS